MIDAIQSVAVREACKACRVRELYVFGSVANGTEQDGSDVDLLVDFERSGYEGAFDQLMTFKERMEAVLSRPVDLVVNRPFRNSFFQKEIDRTKRLVYAA